MGLLVPLVAPRPEKLAPRRVGLVVAPVLTHGVTAGVAPQGENLARKAQAEKFTNFLRSPSRDASPQGSWYFTGCVHVEFGGPFQLLSANERVLASSNGLMGPVITTLTTLPEPLVVTRTLPEP